MLIFEMQIPIHYIIIIDHNYKMKSKNTIKVNTQLKYNVYNNNECYTMENTIMMK